ncbi:hypothetical protein, variant 1 [Spizellomyces punctatus DAOM BR117]|nr:hypothetical protein, variant 1 [Spizellomyces punctatus DAOM BR117]KND03048.1 hypothetical protein, variant 1 [Spizellomyces punctatus DAOM BR117]|eukprot:XP_016611087.1 hypothetical protein, variant 1 [Spizellomyces punctatus DAOM BR117]
MLSEDENQGASPTPGPSADKTELEILPHTLTAKRRRQAADTEVADFRNIVISIANEAFEDTTRLATGEPERLGLRSSTTERLALWPLPPRCVPRLRSFVDFDDVDIESPPFDSENNGLPNLFQSNGIQHGSTEPSNLAHQINNGEEALDGELQVLANELWYSEWLRECKVQNRSSSPVSSSSDGHPVCPRLGQLHKQLLRKETAGMILQVLRMVAQVRAVNLEGKQFKRRPALSDWESVLNAAAICKVPDSVLANARRRLERLYQPKIRKVPRKRRRTHKCLDVHDQLDVLESEEKLQTNNDEHIREGEEEPGNDVRIRRKGIRGPLPPPGHALFSNPVLSWAEFRQIKTPRVHVRPVIKKEKEIQLSEEFVNSSEDEDDDGGTGMPEVKSEPV